MCRIRRTRFSEKGGSLIELLVSLTFVAILAAMALPNLNILNDPLRNGANSTLGYFKQVRARAISTTSAYLVAPTSTNTIEASFANDCGASTFTPERTLRLELPTGVNMTSTTWSVCYSPRGLPESNVTVTVEDAELQSKSIELMLGGGVHVY